MTDWSGVIFIIHLSFMFALLFVAALTDLLQNKIANRLVIIGLAAAVVLALLEAQLSGLTRSAAGASVAFISFFMLYVLGGVGAGDAKLMTAVGALTSWRFVLWSTFFTAVVGAFVVLFYIGINKNWKEAFSGAFSLKRKERMKEIADTGSKRTVPYAIAICLGSMWAFYEYFNYYGVAPWITN